MLTPQQNPASGCATVILETARSKIQIRKRYYREEYNNTHASDFIKQEILDVIHRRGCLQIVIAALRSCPNFRSWSIIIWSQRTFIFVVDVTQSDNLMEDVKFFFGAALGFF